MPFDLNVRLENTSKRPVAVGAFAKVRISGVDGTPGQMELEQGVLAGSLYDMFELEPGETKVGSVANSNLFLFDSDVNGPGVYEIVVELHGTDDQAEPGWEFVDRVNVPAVRMTRYEPSGDDAVIWRLMKECLNGTWYSNAFSRNQETIELANRILSEYPSSSYAPYAVLGRGKVMTSLEEALEAVERFRGSPAYARILIAAGVTALREAESAAAQGRDADVMKCLRHAESFNEEALRRGTADVQAHARSNLGVARHEIERARKGRLRDPE